MFGFGFFGKTKNIETQTPSSAQETNSGVIRVSDYVGTLSEDLASDPEILTIDERGVILKIVRTDVLQTYNEKTVVLNKKYRDMIVGSCDGEFPIANPVSEHIYFNKNDRKYYRCITGTTGTVTSPDNKFEVISLQNLNSKIIRNVNITGAAKGNGSVSNGVINVNTTVNYADVTGKPTTMPNPQALTISLNGVGQPTYTGSSAVSFNINASNIGAQPKGDYALSNHNHDGKYQPVGNYSTTDHNHDDRYYTEGEVNSKLSTYLPLAGGTLKGELVTPLNSGLKYISKDGSPKWLIHNNSGEEIGIGYSNNGQNVPVRVYGSLIVNRDKTVWHNGNFDPNSKANANHNHDSAYAKVGHNHNDLYYGKSEVDDKLKGYAVGGHNHDSVYSKLGHTHTSDNITAMTGYTKATSFAAVSASDNLNTAIGKLEKGLDTKQPAGSYAPSSHNHNDLYNTKSEVTNLLSSYSKNGHNHNDLYNTKSEVTNLLAGKLGKGDNAVSASKLATARSIAINGAVNGSATFDGSANISINTSLAGFDAGKITSGVISVDRLPKTALSEFIAVANKEARLKLTKTQVQNGDTVKETDSKRMYLVIDDTKLSTEEGYQEYTTIVDWSTITGKPSSFTPSSHTHTWEQITNRPSSMKNPTALSVQLNGGTANVYDGSIAKTINITPASIGAQVAGSYATANHNHDSVYAKISHGTHVTYSTDAPKANGTAAAGTAAAVSRADHVHPLQTSVSGNAGSANKWSTARTITLTGDASGSVSIDGTANVNLPVTIANDSHTHSWGNITGKPSTFTPSSHTHATSEVRALTGYTKAEAFSAITVEDALNTAIGKLEKGLDTKSDSGHTHAWTSITGRPSTMPNPNNLVIKLNGAAGVTYNGSAAGEVNITPAGIGAQPAGNYATSGHNHDDRYFTEAEINSKLGGYLPKSGGTMTGDITMDTGKSFIGSYNHGYQAKKSDGNPIYALLVGTDGKLHLGYNNTIPLLLDSDNVFVRGDHKVWHAGNFDPNSKANTSHGNHVPSVQTADNSTYLRNDNTWHKITPADIGAQPKGNYSTVGHGHSWGEISGKPTTMPNPNGLTLQLNGKTATTYTGSSAATVNITPASIGAQPSGNYSTVGHTHDDRYYIKSESDNKFATKSEVSNKKVNPDGVVFNGWYTYGRMDNISRNLVGSCSSNKLFGLDPKGITIEYSRDGGSTWVDYGANEWEKRSLVTEQVSMRFSLGKGTTKEDNVNFGTKAQLRITFDSKADNRYASIDSAFIWFNTNGNTSRVTMQKAKTTSPDTWENVFVDKELSGWSGPNMYYFPKSTFGGQNTNYHKVRFVFKQIAINSSYPTSLVYDIRLFGLDTWNAPNNMMHHGKLYDWDPYQNMLVPKGLKILNGELLLPYNRGIKYDSDNNGALKWLIHNNNGNEIGIGYTGDQAKPVKIYGSLVVNGDKAVWHSGNFNPATKSDTNHNHDSTYSKNGHTHDDRYYTESEINSKLGGYLAKGSYTGTAADLKTLVDGKAPTSHTHTWAQISDRPSSMKNPTALSIQLNGGTANVYDGSAAKTINITAASIGAQVAGSYASSSHNHDSVYSKLGHNHDDRYFTETEVTEKLKGYSLTSHNHNGVYAPNVHNHDDKYQPKGSYAAASHTHPYLSTSGGTISGALTVTGQILSNADVVAYSDARFKSNIELIADPIVKLNQINGYTYDMMGVDDNRTHQVGVIAQEVQKVLPEAVYEDSNGHLGVRYTNLVPLLIEVAKEQDKTIKSQEERIAKLESQLQKLLSKLS